MENVLILNLMKDFDENVDCFIDSGESKLGVASTIVRVLDGIPHILREGSITKEEAYNHPKKNMLLKRKISLAFIEMKIKKL